MVLFVPDETQADEGTFLNLSLDAAD